MVDFSKEVLYSKVNRKDDIACAPFLQNSFGNVVRPSFEEISESFGAEMLLLPCSSVSAFENHLMDLKIHTPRELARA